jgi:peptide-methionine (S)-S-oxide reductase
MPASSSDTPTLAGAMPAETITLGGGCFWCLEAVFLQVHGVESVQSGYTNGQIAQPSYEAVCAGGTGHAEVVQLRFAPDVLSLADLLRIFFAIHDPTTPNRQGHDVGTQYRSGIYWHDPKQIDVAKSVIQEAAQAWSAPIVTELQPVTNYWPAEAYHQRYYQNHPSQGYCAYVIAPKVNKFRQVFAQHQHKG